MTLGSKLQLLRKQKGMSQEMLAQELQLSRQTISKWELDVSQPDLDKVVHISKIFGVSCDYLLIDEIEEQRNVHTEEPVIHEKKSYEKTIISWALVALGFLGHLAILVMSSVVEVMVPFKIRQPDGSILYKYSSDHYGHDYGIFIDEHNLEVLWVIFSVALAVGIILLLDEKYNHKISAKLKDIIKKLAK